MEQAAPAHPNVPFPVRWWCPQTLRNRLAYATGLIGGGLKRPCEGQGFLSPHEQQRPIWGCISEGLAATSVNDCWDVPGNDLCTSPRLGLVQIGHKALEAICLVEVASPAHGSDWIAPVDEHNSTVEAYQRDVALDQ
eukprot:14252243-Alexandrium_andersonii.AAC.1